MTDPDAQALADKALAAMATALHLADVPLLDLSLPQKRSEDHRAEVADLHRDYLAEQGQMDRYLDSRDSENDDVSKEWVLTATRHQTLYTFAQPKGAPATGDDHDRS